MAKLFGELQERLLRAGVAPRHVRRYVKELSDHLADLTAEEERAGRGHTDAEAAALARLGSEDELAKAMIARREFQAWSARAPWAVFGCGSLCLLAGAYFLACIYLWILWQAFLPGADTPFGHAGIGPMYGFRNICIQAGKFYYIGAPILAGWGMGVIAARQRVKAVWLAIGLAVIGWMGSTAQIQASRTAILGGVGHIRMRFFGERNFSQNIFGALAYLIAVLLIGALPYMIWRFQRAHSNSIS
jgi:hypothetical protein